MTLGVSTSVRFGNTTGLSNVSSSFGIGVTPTGSSNVFIGDRVGNTGSDNVFIGYFAGNENLSAGNDNVYIGNEAGEEMTNGDDNVIIGSNTGEFRTGGNKNVIIGNEAGRESGDGEGNIFIGFQAGYFETGDDKLYIDGTGDTNPLIYGDFVLDELRIYGSLWTRDGCSNCSSDLALKTNITAAQSAVAKLSSLRGVYFDWADGTSEQEFFPQRQLGLIAQEVEKVYPELVGTDGRGFKFVRYQKLVAPLIEAVKEQQSQIDALRSALCSALPDAEPCR
ncbi:MAG: tail fiber domain-containing protein [Acidobacteriota bacterium]